MSVEPEASTVKLLGVVLITIFDNEQISALLEILFEIKAFPSIKQVQELGGRVDLRLPITDTLVSRERIKPYKRL